MLGSMSIRVDIIYTYIKFQTQLDICYVIHNLRASWQHDKRDEVHAPHLPVRTLLNYKDLAKVPAEPERLNVTMI